jgi:hypothetical protein
MQQLPVMAGLVPAIHVFLVDVAEKKKDVDARRKAGHDADGPVLPD